MEGDNAANITVQLIQRLSSGEEKDLNKLHSYLKTNEHRFAAQIDVMFGLLDVISPAVETLGWIYILHAKVRAMTAVQRQDPVFSARVVQLSLDADPEQLVISPQILAPVVKVFVDSHMQLQAPNALGIVVQTLRHFLNSYTAIHPSHFCFIHPLILRVCLKGLFVSTAQTILDNFPTIDLVFSESIGFFDALDVLSFFYYSGLVHIALTDFKSALCDFTNVFAFPISSLSAVVIEAYKKYMLCSLIVSGKYMPLPKYTEGSTFGHLKDTCKEYEELVDAFGARKLSDLSSVISKHKTVFVSDKNLGLVEEVARRLLQNNIHRLTKTYVTFALADISSKVGLSAENPEDIIHVENSLVEMIVSGRLRASIDGSNMMVHFGSRPEAEGSSEDDFEVLRRLHERLKESVRLFDKSVEVGRNIQILGLSAAELARLSKNKQQIASASTTIGSQH